VKRFAAKLKVKKGDNVIVISGDDKGKKGTILSVDTIKMRVLVEGINKVKKHTKPSASNPDGGIVEKEAYIHVSNVALLDGDTPSKVGRRIEGDKIVRFLKKSNKTL
jgi:large subunit ribosomal protein L24